MTTLPTILRDNDTKAHCYAVILQTLHALLQAHPEGVTYEEIQKHIEETHGWYMSAVNRRCQEMAKLPNPFIVIVHRANGVALVKYREVKNDGS